MSAYRPHLFLFGANLIYGANYTIAKVAMDGWIGPFGFVAVRVTVSLALFFLAHRILLHGRPGTRIARRDWPRLMLCGLFGVATNQLLFFQGLSMTSEIHASLIMITTPVLVLIIARLVLREAVTLRKALGVLCGGTGVAWLILQSRTATEPASVAGDVFVLVNATSYAIYLVLVKRLMDRYHPLTVIRWVFFFGLFVVLPVGAGQLPDVPWGNMPLAVWGSIAYVVLGTTFLAYLLNIWAIRDVSPAVVSAWIYTQPVVAAVIALAVGNDRLTWQKAAAGLVVVIGVGLVSFARRRGRPPAPAAT